MKNNITKYVVIIILAGVLINAAGFILFGTLGDWSQKKFIDSDASAYYLLAKNILAGHGFSLADSVPYLPSRFRVPAYPLFMAGILAVFGNIFAVLALQEILSIINAVILFFLLKNLLKKELLAFTLSILFLLDPLVFRYENGLMTETLLIFFLLLAIYFFVKYLSSERLKYIGFSAIFLGCAALTKPIIQFLPWIFSAAIIFWGVRRGVLRKSLTAVLVLIVVFFSVLSPWLIRNKIQFGNTHLSSNDWYNIYYVNTAAVLAVEQGKNWMTVQEELIRETPPLKYSRELDYFGVPVSSELAGRAVGVCLKYPWSVVRVAITGTLRFFIDEGGQDLGYALSPNSIKTVGLGTLISRGEYIKAVSELFSRRPVVLIPMILFKIVWLALLFFIFYGLWHARREADSRQKLIIFLSVAIVLYFAVLSVPNTEARTRMPAIPFFMILAGYGVKDFVERKGYLNNKNG